MADKPRPFDDSAGREPHEASYCFAPAVVGNSYDSHFGYVGMFEEDILDLNRKQILATADDHVLHSAGDRYIAPSVHGAEVSGVQPPVAVDRLGGRLGIVVIADHDAIALRTNLAHGADGHHCVAVRIAD